ncbi:Class IV aminotransferase [Quillaja saponaria]|uniref:Class IV aminotransferase n=1 Tax=Quillaja saponaria TaxID=32244 RepID=A0AAD7LKA1_QUISA|nr:Class IV aminotransferase [Quillaja saponaria]
MAGSRFLFSNGIISHVTDAPPVTVFLESHPGAYTTSRTSNNASCLLFWKRHMKRLSESIRILSNLSPQFIFKMKDKSTISLPASMTLPIRESALEMLVNDAISKVLPIAMNERSDGEELAITTLVFAKFQELSENGIRIIDDEESVSKVLDVNVHVGTYVPPAFGTLENGAHLAVVGRGRHVAPAKYSDWVRIRKPLEKLRPPSVTELLLSNDGDRVLEGCVTNFFVVCSKACNEAKTKDDYGNIQSFEVQTAPVCDGVLPGIVRQLVIEICLSKGIPFREVAPSWSEHLIWEEAFITNGLRLLQHVDTIQVPREWESINSKTWKEISWAKKRFQVGPGMITTIIRKEIMEKAMLEGYPLCHFK